MSIPPDHPDNRRRRARAIAISQQQARMERENPSLAFATTGFVFSVLATISVAFALAML